MNRDDCNKWLRRQVEEKARRLTLTTVSSELRKGSEELLAVKIPARKPPDKWFKSTVRAVEDAVKRDMETLEAPTQAYALIAHDADGEFKDRFSFREIDVDADQGPPVEPTTTGLMVQLMHHNKDLARTMADMHKAGMSYYERTLGQLTDSHAKLIEERLDTIKVVESLRSEELERRLALKREESDDDVRAQILSKLMTLAPVVVAKLTGKSLPGAMSESDAMMAAFMESLSPDQLERLMPVLKPEQAMIIMSLIENFKRREEQAKEVQPTESKANGQPVEVK